MENSGVYQSSTRNSSQNTKKKNVSWSSPTKGPMASTDSQTNDVRHPHESVLLPQQFGLLCHQKGSPRCCRVAMPSPVDRWKEKAAYKKTSVPKTADGCTKEAASWGGSKRTMLVTTACWVEKSSFQNGNGKIHDSESMQFQSRIVSIISKLMYHLGPTSRKTTDSVVFCSHQPQ